MHLLREGFRKQGADPHIFGERFKSGGGVHGRADDSKIQSCGCTDVPIHNFPDIDADAETQRLLAGGSSRVVEGAHRGAGAGHGAQRVFAGCDPVERKHREQSRIP